MSGLEKKEQERKEVAAQFAAKSAPSWLVNLVNAGQVVAPKVVSKPALVAVSPKKDIMKAALTKNSGFSLLKVS
jgi:hypothetical protein